MEAIIETCRTIFFKKTSLLLVGTVFLATAFSIWHIFLPVKTVFPSSGNVFLTNSSFRLVETERVFSFLFRAFLKLLKFGSGNSCLRKLIFWLVELIFSHFSDTASSESYLPSSGNVCLNKFSNPHSGDAFSVLWKPFSLIQYFFLQVETVTKISGNPFWGRGKTLFPENGRF